MRARYDLLDTVFDVDMSAKEKKQINVALACVIEGGEVLLTKRREPRQPDINEMWELPGGKVEFGESPLTTVIREVKEETGCEVKNPMGAPFPYVAIRDYDKYAQHTIISCYQCELVSRPQSFVPSQRKVVEARWFGLKDLDFLDVMAGSREFICWVAKNRYNIDLERETDRRLFSYISFECYVPSENHKKFYLVNIAFNPDPFSKRRYTLTSLWGRITSRGRMLSSFYEGQEPQQIKVEHFEEAEAMHAALKRICNARIKHSYLIVGFKSNFPLKEWLDKNKDNWGKVETQQLVLDI